MTAPLALGIDIGTTGLKAVVLDPRVGVIAQTHRHHTLRSPHPGWAEEDPAEWWETTCAAVRELVRQIPERSIAAVGVTGMVPAMVLLDEDGQVLRPAILMNDVRAAVEVEELRQAIAPETFFAWTGGMPNQQNIEPRWRWLVKNEPDVIARTAHLCGSYDYIVHQLTGLWSLERNWAVESGLYDIHHHGWMAEWLDRTGIRKDALPPVRLPSEIVGEVSDDAAAATGLAVGTPVVAGSADHVAAALAAGLTEQGDTLLKFGGGGDILYCTDAPTPDPRFYFDEHDVPGLSLINGCMAASGSLVKWFAAELAGGASLADLDREAAAVPPGSSGIVALPYALGEKTPIFDPLARGVFAGVMLHHTRAHLYRAVLEAVCFGFQHHLELLTEAGYPIRRLLATDGGSRSDLWMQIAADITGRRIEVVAGEAGSALGAAFVAGMGVGLFEQWSEVTRFAGVRRAFEPQLEAVERYRAAYRVYRELYERLGPVFPQLQRIETSGDAEGAGRSI